MGDLQEYKCPACGAPLAFDPSSGDVKCAACGNVFKVESVVEAQSSNEITEEFNWGNYKNSLSSETLAETTVYQCQSCGAVVETDSTTVATKCPYCDNNIVLADRVSAGLKPNAVIPFKIEKKQVPELLRNFYRDKKLLPKNFFTENDIGKVQGVYVPFWLFESGVSGTVSYDATRVRVYVLGKEEITETSRFRLERAGNMHFNNVPCDASTRLDNDLMDSLEPFDYSAMVPFDGQYLAGFVADRFDSDPDAELPRAGARMIASANEAFKDTTGSYNMVSLHSSNFNLDNPEVKYVLLPVYILNCSYGGKTYRYAVNGQTGKVVGDVPTSYKQLAWRLAAAFGASTAAAAALLALIMR